MVNSLEPIKVDINVENPSLQREAFYNLCFITNNDVAPRTLEVKTLSDLLDNGYTRLDLAYNFCVGVFSQEGISSVFLRAKRSDESYIDAYKSDENDSYYYIIIESKKELDILDFNDYLNSNDEMKLQFYSNKYSIEGNSPTLVSYYQNYDSSSEVVGVEDVDYYLDWAYLKPEEEVDDEPVEFLKLRGEIIRVTQGNNAGIVYKLNDQDVQESIMSVESEGTVSHSTVTAAAVMGYSDMSYSFITYDPDLLGIPYPPPAPAPLDPSYSYILGVNLEILSEFFASVGQELPEGYTPPIVETVVTLYPASKIPNGNINFDLFDLIIDPKDYTKSDLDYFSARGIKPAIKNADGSYTIRSQLKLI